MFLELKTIHFKLYPLHIFFLYCTILPCSTCAPKNRKERLMVVFAFLLDTEGPRFIECYTCNPSRPEGHDG